MAAGLSPFFNFRFIPAEPERVALVFPARLSAAMLIFLLSGCDHKKSDGHPNPRSENAETKLVARLAVTSPALDLEDIFPYEEALITDEYQVIKTISGPQPESDTIRIARWAISNKTPLPDPAQIGESRTIQIKPFLAIPELNSVFLRNDLPYNPEEQLYYDLTPIPDTYVPPAIVRYDYHGDISKHMQVYWLIRNQLKLVAIGNSHTGAAVDTRKFYQPGNAGIPVTLGLTPAGSGYSFQCLLANKYLASLPDLEWVIWGVSPRIFNQHFATDPQAKRFESSPGFQYDTKHWDELMKEEADNPLLTAQQLKEKLNSPYQFWERKRKRTSTFSKPLGPESRQQILQQCDRRHFEWNERAWSEFEKSVTGLAQKNIKVLLFIPPYHPLVAQTQAVDEDGTGKEDYGRIVNKLRILTENIDGIFFLDTHKGGQHGIGHEHFTDIGHLYESGTRILTVRLLAFIKDHTE